MLSMSWFIVLVALSAVPLFCRSIISHFSKGFSFAVGGEPKNTGDSFFNLC